jgi:beta-lactamase class A
MKSMFKYPWNKNIFGAVILALLIFSLGGNIFLFNKIKNNQPSTPVNFRFVSPNEFMSIDSNIQVSNIALHYRPLREQIEERLKSLPTEQKIGVYLQDAYSGTWLGINERESFVPASLLKIPIAMAIFKKVERGELLLNQKISIESADIDTLAGVAERFEYSEVKSISELLKLMIKVSDNTAKNALKRQLLPEDINEVFTHVGMENPYIKEDENQLVTPRQFSRLFKSLYFSTFLTPEFSEKLLELATETRAESLISTGVPWEIQVSHKYGERFDLLHDCGIIYYPQNHYFLCVMTKEIPLPEAQNLIKDISSDIYKFISEK